MIAIEKYFLVFIMYSIVGWVMEVIATYPDTKTFVNRGFLIGPYCPIYGWGYLIITLLLKKFMDEPIALFFLIVIVCSFVEYITSYLMEKMFHARWWDYSHKKYNIEGRICLTNSAAFGILGMISLYFINPFFEQIIDNFSTDTIHISAIILFIIYVADNIISFCVTTSMKNKIKAYAKDNTAEIKDKIMEIFKENSHFWSRIKKAFPSVESSMLKKIKEKMNK